MAAAGFGEKVMSSVLRYLWDDPAGNGFGTVKIKWDVWTADQVLWIRGCLQIEILGWDCSEKTVQCKERLGCKRLYLGQVLYLAKVVDKEEPAEDTGREWSDE